MGQAGESAELGLFSMKNHLKWKQRDIERRAKMLEERGLIYADKNSDMYRLTERGEMKYNELKSDYGM